MKTRLLLIALTLACGFSGWGQETCTVKRNTCNVDCAEAFRNPGKVAQCKKDCYANVGCATPIPTPTPPPPPRPWDVVASKSGLDTNGLLRTPVWNWAAQGGPLRDACADCPCSPSFPLPSWLDTLTCTSQPHHAQYFPPCLIPINSNDSGFPYHMNWFPVEYEGSLAWEDHSTWTTDNEYQFNILGPNQELVTKGREGKGVHLEFSSSETVDEWDGTGTWWENFHHNIVDKLDTKDAIRNAFGTHFAIVIGLLGLDVAHSDHHSELHPVYAMFISLPTGPAVTSVDHWAFFVRNWGFEGFCGPNDEALPGYQAFQVQLPDRVLLDYNMWSYTHGGNSDACNANTVSIDRNGLLTFQLGSPANKCGIVGDLTMRRGPATIGQPSPTTGTAAAVRASQESGREDEDPALSAKIAKLSPSDRQQLYKQLSELMREPRGKPTIGQIKLIKLSHPVPQVKRAQVAGKDVTPVADPAEQAREAKKRQFMDAFLKEHGIQ